MTDLPRTLLITRWPPDARYAGGEVQRKIVSRLPRERLRWAYLSGRTGDSVAGPLPESRGFPVRMLHWRFSHTWLQSFFTHLQAHFAARRIEEWIRPFAPEAIWIASDGEGIVAGNRLRRSTGLPCHVTVYDAFEWCRFCGIGPLYYRFYMQSVRACMAHADSLDAMTPELIEHVQTTLPCPWNQRTMAFPPSILLESLNGLPRPRPGFCEGDPRKIGFCGAARSGNDQWEHFLKMLAGLPWRFKIVTFSAPDCFYSATLPANVSVQFQPYAPDELTIVRRFREEGVHACYLGLWDDPERELFARTSLSSKLTTYAASLVPVIVDGPAGSSAWRLVQRYKAGVRVGRDAADGAGSLRAMFEDENGWDAMSRAMESLCVKTYDLDRHVEALGEVFREIAGGAGSMKE